MRVRLVRRANQGSPLIKLVLLLIAVGVIAELFSLKLAPHDPPPRILIYDDGAQEEKSPFRLLGDYLRKNLEAQYQAEGYEPEDDPCGRPQDAAPQRLALVKHEPSRGSLESLIELDAHQACESSKENRRGTLAVVQADVVHHYLLGNHPQFLQGHPESAVRSIARLLSERLDLSFRMSETAGPIKRPTCDGNQGCDPLVLEAESACAGAVGSGTLVVMLNLARFLPTHWSNLHACDYNRDTAAWMVEGNASGFTKLHKPDAIGLSRGSARVLESSLKRGIYKSIEIEGGQGWTISWDSLLVSNRELSDDALKHVERAMKDLAALCRPEAGLLDQDIRSIIKDTDFCSIAENERHHELPISLHPTLLLETLDPPSRWVASFTDPVMLKIVLLTLLTLSLLASVTPLLGPAVRLGVNRNLISSLAKLVVGTQAQWLFMLACMLGFHLLIGVLVWLSELHAHALSSDVEYVEGGLRRAFDWVIRFVVLGSSDIELKSTLALTWVALLRAGWAVASGALLIGLVQTATRGWKALRMENHIVIVGWSEHGQRLVEELRRQRVHFRLCVVAPERPAPPNIDADAIVPYPMGGLAKCIEDALALKPRGIVVLGDHAQASAERHGDTDLWVARQVLTIDEIRASRGQGGGLREGPRGIRLVAEVQHECNIRLIARAGADDVVCLQSFGSELLAQVTSKDGIRAVIEDLLSTKPGTHELYVVPLTPMDIWRYRSFERLASLHADRSRDRIPLGILRAKPPSGVVVPLLNPRGLAARLRRGDQLITMARASTSQPSLNAVTARDIESWIEGIAQRSPMQR